MFGGMYVSSVINLKHKRIAEKERWCQFHKELSKHDSYEC